MDAKEQERQLAETQYAAELRAEFEALARAQQPRRRRRLVVIAAAAAAVLAALVGGAALAGAFSSDSPHHWVEDPDLMAARATNGKLGYICR
jgi:hypothetical protein